MGRDTCPVEVPLLTQDRGGWSLRRAAVLRGKSLLTPGNRPPNISKGRRGTSKRQFKHRGSGRSGGHGSRSRPLRQESVYRASPSSAAATRSVLMSVRTGSPRRYRGTRTERPPQAHRPLCIPSRPPAHPAEWPCLQPSTHVGDLRLDRSKTPGRTQARRAAENFMALRFGGFGGCSNSLAYRGSLTVPG
jgi:hypothetical protein